MLYCNGIETMISQKSSCSECFLYNQQIDELSSRVIVLEVITYQQNYFYAMDHIVVFNVGQYKEISLS